MENMQRCPCVCTISYCDCKPNECKFKIQLSNQLNQNKMEHFENEQHYQSEMNYRAETEHNAMMEANGRAEMDAQIHESECKAEPQTDRELTFGEKLVGLTFNPSGDEKVNRAKVLCAELADLLNDHNNSKVTHQFTQRLFSHAIGEILNAQMNVVKVLTLKY